MELEVSLGDMRDLMEWTQRGNPFFLSQVYKRWPRLARLPVGSTVELFIWRRESLQFGAGEAKARSQKAKERKAEK